MAYLRFFFLSAAPTSTLYFSVSANKKLLDCGSPTLREELWKKFLPKPLEAHWLFADIIMRMCEGLARGFLVFYVTTVIGISVAAHGVLAVALETTAIRDDMLTANFADPCGRNPFVISAIFCAAWKFALANCPTQARCSSRA